MRMCRACVCRLWVHVWELARWQHGLGAWLQAGHRDGADNGRQYGGRGLQVVRGALCAGISRYQVQHGVTSHAEQWKPRSIATDVARSLYPFCSVSISLIIHGLVRSLWFSLFEWLLPVLSICHPGTMDTEYHLRHRPHNFKLTTKNRSIILPGCF